MEQKQNKERFDLYLLVSPEEVPKLNLEHLRELIARAVPQAEVSQLIRREPRPRPIWPGGAMC